MPPRSKQHQRQPEWSLCERCSCHISTRDIDVHSEVCKEDEPFSYDLCDTKNSLQQLRHCFFHSSSVVARLDVEKVQREGSKTPQKEQQQVVAKSKKMENQIYMHPSTMTLCGLTFLSPAVVDHQCVLIAVPDARLSITGICVNEWTAQNILGKNSGQFVAVSALNNPDFAVTEVHVRLINEKSCIMDEGFFLHCSHQWVGTFVAVGSHVRVNYLGSLHELEVVTIVIENGEIVGSDAVDINDGLSSVHISSDQNIYHCKSSQRFFRCINGTCVKQYKPPSANSGNMRPAVTLDDVGGVDNEKDFLNRLISSMLDINKATAVKQSGIHLPRAVLIYGPSGTGKTLLVRALANSMQLYLVTIGGSAILSPYVGESEQHLRRLFAEARRKAPSMILLDEIDAMCPQQRSSNNDIERRLVSCVCSQLDAILAEDCRVFVVAITRKRDNVNSALTTSTRIGIECEISVPNATQRSAILECQLKAVKHELSSSDIADVAGRAHGFVGADLAAVCYEAKQHSICRQSEDHAITPADLQYGLKVVQPSAMKELAIEKPNVHWSDIGGVHELKLKLEQSIVWPIRYPELFARLGCRPPRGHLLYGPPGCSKTMIAKALATESDLNFIAVKGPELLSKWVGESEKAVRELFRRARAAAPAIIFFDEIDALAVQRGRQGGGAGDVVDRVMAQLLTEIDGVIELKDITILAATNRPDLIDKALKRPGRLDREIYVGLPDDAARREIFEILFHKTPVADDVDIDQLVQRTHRYSGAEVAAVVHEAAMSSLSEGIQSGNLSTHVYSRHFDSALTAVKPRITADQLRFYNDYASQRSKHL